MAAKKKQGEVSQVAEVSVALPRVDPASAVAIAKHVQELLKQPSIAGRFKALPRSEFDARGVDSYAALTAAVETAGNAYLVALTAEVGASVPLALVQQASALKARMFGCAEHNLETEDAQRRLDAIRPGAGYLDLVNDLIGLSSLFTDYRDALMKDGNKYRPTDAAEASRLAGEIQLSLASVHRAATRNAGRKWALAFDKLRTVHEDLIETGRWLDRRRDDAIERWPSLFAVLRQSSKSAKSKVAPAAPTA